MNGEFELKVQAYLDGELPEREARRVAGLIEADPALQSLVAELHLTKSMLRENEPQAKVPEDRDFYWSRIAREIERQDRQPGFAPRSILWRRCRRWLAPLAGLALVAFLAISAARFYDGMPLSDPLRHLAEVENESEHMGSVSFRSHAENMFVVWVYDRTAEVDAEPEFDPLEELFFQ